MSTITEFDSNDTGSEVMGALNTNFDNLNDDKIEADSTDTLENKTIDADDNTITNLGVAEFATASKTGVDAKVVTGTKGDVNEIAMWNTDGDLVSADVTIVTSVSEDSTDTTIPSAQAVYEYVQDQLQTRELIVTHSYTNGTPTNVNNYPAVSLNSGQVVAYTFQAPANFGSISSIYALMIPDATETIQWDAAMNYGAVGETNNSVSVSDSNRQLSATANLITQARIDDGTNLAASLVGLAANDLVGILITSDTTVLRIVGLKIVYNLA